MFESVARLDAQGVKGALAAGADPNARSERGFKEGGHTALMLAVQWAYPEHKQGDCVEICRALANAGADVNGMGTLGYSALHEACNIGCGQIVKVLLAAGGDPNAKSGSGGDPKRGGRAPMSLALALGAEGEKQEREQIALDLFMAGADPGVLDCRGERADHCGSKDLLAKFVALASARSWNGRRGWRRDASQGHPARYDEGMPG